MLRSPGVVSLVLKGVVSLVLEAPSLVLEGVTVVIWPPDVARIALLLKIKLASNGFVTDRHSPCVFWSPSMRRLTEGCEMSVIWQRALQGHGAFKYLAWVSPLGVAQLCVG